MASQLPINCSSLIVDRCDHEYTTAKSSGNAASQENAAGESQLMGRPKDNIQRKPSDIFMTMLIERSVVH